VSAALEHAQAAAGDQPRGLGEEDFYVGRTGAVANPRGFDRWLADFIGWQMPQLPAGDGREAPLYMELGLPAAVSSRSGGGWGGILAQMTCTSASARASASACAPGRPRSRTRGARLCVSSETAS
jgi:hypothetical protein